jgi:hypothetical protein
MEGMLAGARAEEKTIELKRLTINSSSLRRVPARSKEARSGVPY